MAKNLSNTLPSKHAPVIILVNPQLGENIGAVARAMLNCGLTELSLVCPRDPWPNSQAQSVASGADDVVNDARIYECVEDSISDLNRVYAATARARDMVIPVMHQKEAARDMLELMKTGAKVGILFGGERAGLSNDDVALADVVIEIPLNPSFRSLNLAQAVLIICYEWHMGIQEGKGNKLISGDENYNNIGTRLPVRKKDLLYFLSRLETELDECGFLSPPEKRPTMVRAIRNMFQRTQLTDQDVRTLHGIVSGLTRRHER